MNQNLLNEFDIIYDKYLEAPELYRTDVIRNETNVPDIEILADPNIIPTQNEINDILTKSVTKYFLNSTETILDIINLYVQIYEYAINKYINTHPQYDLDENKIWFVLKGGLSMFLNISKEVFKMSGSIGEFFNELFVKKAFSKSDIDFAILIDYDKIDTRYHEIIFNDIHNLSFIVLLIVRNYIVKNKYEFSDFDKNNDEYKKITLNKIRTNINQILLNNGVGKLGNNFCKIGTNKFYEEEPCPNNVEITNDVVYDEIYIHSRDNYNNITINHPKRIGDIILNPQNKYIISSNIIEYLTLQNQLVKFGLTRMKVFFGLYKLNKDIHNVLGCCDYKKGKGEIIDVGISHYDNNTHPLKTNYDRYIIGEYEFEMPTLNYFKEDHYLMLLINYKFPWNLPKFEKRLDRFFSFSLIEIMNLNLNTENINQLIIFFNTYLKHLELNNSNPNYISNPLMNRSLDNNEQNYDLEVIKGELVDLINQPVNRLNQENYNEELDNLNNFITKLTFNIKNVILILNEISNYIKNPTITFHENNLSVRTNMFGGVDICNMDNSQKILKNIINKMVNISSNLSLNTNIHERFYDTYRKLIKTYLNNQSINQVFIDNSNGVIYDSSLDLTDDMIEYDGSRKVLKNTILNFTSFMFLNYLLDYHCFLITFQNERFNTDISNEPNGTKNFRTLFWTKTIRESDLYRHNLIGKNPEELLKDFCYDINTKFYRFISMLLKNLKIRLSAYLPINLPPNPPINLTLITIDDLKNIMFATKHHGINNYDETSMYNYMYHCWKNRLAKWMGNKYEGLDMNNFSPLIAVGINMENLKKYFLSEINICIKNTIQSLLNQNGSNEFNERYISDSGGLFSYSYMLRRPLMKKNNYNTKTYYTSCISSSIIEMYFLIRIYENPNYVGFGSESSINDVYGRHPYWTITQRAIGHAISHWTCKWNRLVWDGNEFVRRIFIFRNVYNNVNNRTIMLSNVDSKKLILKYFLLVLIDYRIEYIRQNNFTSDAGTKSQFLRDELATKIINYID